MKQALLISALLTAGTAMAAEYQLDPNHTNVRFAIKHFDTSTNRAGIYNLQGKMQFDREAKTSSIDLAIPLKGLSSGNEHFDQHLLSADILDAEKYPEIAFKSTKFNFDGDKVSSVEGELTMHG